MRGNMLSERDRMKAAAQEILPYYEKSEQLQDFMGLDNRKSYDNAYALRRNTWKKTRPAHQKIQAE